MSCRRCMAVVPPNRCRPCSQCGRDVHIDCGGQLLWPGDRCSACYYRERMAAAAARKPMSEWTPGEHMDAYLAACDLEDIGGDVP